MAWQNTFRCLVANATEFDHKMAIWGGEAALSLLEREVLTAASARETEDSAFRNLSKIISMETTAGGGRARLRM